MKNQKFLLCFLFAMSFYHSMVAQAPKIKVSFGPVYENDSKFSYSKSFLKDAKGSIYAINWGEITYNSQKGNNFLERYDANLKLEAKKELKAVKVNGNEIDCGEFGLVNGKPFGFGSFFNKSDSKRYLFALPIKEDCTLDKPIKIAELSCEKNTGFFHLSYSDDSSKILIISQIEDKIKDKFNVVFSVLNAQFKEEWKSKYIFPKDTDMEGFSEIETLNRFTVDNKGRVFTLMNLPIDKVARVKNGPLTTCKFFLFENGAKEPKKINVDLGKKRICDFNFLPSAKSDEIVAIGSCAEADRVWIGSGSGINGSFYLKLNLQSSLIVTKSVNPFSRKMFGFMKTTEKEEQKGIGVNDFSVRNIVQTDKNNFLLSFEHNYTISRQGFKNTEHYSDVIFNVKYDTDGKIIYQNYVPKAAFAYNCNFGLGHILTPKGEGHAFIYNDSRKNEDKELEDYKDLSKANPGSGKCVIKMVSMDEKGGRKVSTLFDNKEDDFALIPNSSFQYAPGVIVSLAVDGKKYKLVKIEN
jgi:hypothetical protein